MCNIKLHSDCAVYMKISASYIKQTPARINKDKTTRRRRQQRKNAEEEEEEETDHDDDNDKKRTLWKKWRVNKCHAFETKANKKWCKKTEEKHALR